jgi:hypothetical protein
MATLGSRSLFHSGNAVKLAAEDALQKLNQQKSELGLAADTPIADVFRKKYGMRAGSIVGVGSFIPPVHAAGRERPDRQCHAVLDGRARAASSSRSTPRRAGCG